MAVIGFLVLCLGAIVIFAWAGIALFVIIKGRPPWEPPYI